MQHFRGTRVEIADFAARIDLSVLYPGEGYFYVRCSDFNRPVIQLTGYFDEFEFWRLQLFGTQETGYMSVVPEETLNGILDTYLQYEIPAIIFSNGVAPSGTFLEKARQNKVPVLVGNMSSTMVIKRVSNYLDVALAPQELLHANLVEVCNVGVMIRAESGLGKSELTLDLIQRGHRMVADDAVVVRKVNERRVVGNAPDTTKWLMEIRGLGIIDVKQLYGISCVLDTKSIDLIVDLELWNSETEYDRFGFDKAYVELMGVKIPHFIIPVRPGRNLASVIEVVAMCHRVHASGYDMEKELKKRLFMDI